METTMSAKRVNITIPVEPELRDAIRDAAKADDRQMADLCRVILRKAVMSEPAAPATTREDGKEQTATSVSQ